MSNNIDTTEPPERYDREELHECPLCGAVQGVQGKPFTEQSHVIAHIQGSKAGNHGSIGYEGAKLLIEGKSEPRARDGQPKGQTSDSDTRQSQSVDGEGIPDPPNVESGASRASAACCDSPGLRSVPAGRSFTTESGQTGTTEQGDRVCESCGALVESDGSVVR